ncbi:MAG TPA: hypothetical protein VGI32_10175 [Steroidobacteraceae bacterium]
MKTLLVLICLAAISSLSSSAAIGRPSNGPTMDSSVSGVALEGPAPVERRAHGKQTALRAQGNLSGLRGTVVSEMRATKAFVKENVKEESADRGLMLLAAIGMIVLQLRRKHKSLPQRQIAPYA